MFLKRFVQCDVPFKHSPLVQWVGYMNELTRVSPVQPSVFEIP